MFVPLDDGLKEFLMVKGILSFWMGFKVKGCNILAPKKASSEASSYDNEWMVLVSWTNLGSLFCNPSISVQISIRSALITLPIIVAV